MFAVVQNNNYFDARRISTAHALKTFVCDDHFLFACFDIHIVEEERGCGRGERRRRCWIGNDRGRRDGNGSRLQQRDMFDKITDYLNSVVSQVTSFTAAVAVVMA